MNSADTLMQFEAAQTQPVPWPDLPEETLPRFPTELLPGGCAELVEALAASLPVPVDYAVGAMLGAASAALVGRVFVQPRSGHREPIQLYLCIGGESGTNKSNPMDRFIEPLEKWLTAHGKEIYRRNRDRAAQREVLDRKTKKKGILPQELSSLRSKIDEMENEPEAEIVITDTTPEKLAHRMYLQGGKGIIYTDEGSFIDILAGSTYAGKGSAPNLDTVLKGFDGGHVFVDRVTSQTVSIEHAHLSITVGMQNGLIDRMTGNANLADRGFPQRVLYFLPDNLTGLNLLDLPSFPQEMMAGWASLLTTLAASHREQPLLLSMTDAAQRVYNLHRQDMHDRTSEDMGSSAAMRAWARKAHGKTARLAGLLALLENPEAMIIEDSHVRAAVTIMNVYFIPHAKKAFGGGSTLSSVACDLWEIVRNKEFFREADLRYQIRGQKRFKGEPGKRLFQTALEELQTEGYIRRKLELPSEGRGRPFSPMWEINPGGRL